MSRLPLPVRPSRQQGLGVIGMLLVVGVIVASVMLLLKLGPHYVDWETMKTIVEELPADRVNKMEKGDIRESLRKRFRVNSLRGFDLRKIIKIDRSKEGTIIQIKYEVREHIVSNIDAVLFFEKQYTYQ